MDETLCVVFKVHFDLALEVWFSIHSHIHNDTISMALPIMNLKGP